jgi:hypothetical protein
MDTDCTHCGRKRHSFFDDHVENLLTYLANLAPGAIR